MSEFVFKLISILFLLLFLFYYVNLKLSKKSNEKNVLKNLKFIMGINIILRLNIIKD